MSFKSYEFQCKCGCNAADMDQELLNMLYEARQIAQIPFVITSGYRCHDHNKNVGGRPGSAHTRGYAVDISANNSRARFIIINALVAAGFTRIGIAKTFIHVDDDPDKDINVAWLY